MPMFLAWHALVKMSDKYLCQILFGLQSLGMCCLKPNPIRLSVFTSPSHCTLVRDKDEVIGEYQQHVSTLFEYYYLALLETFLLSVISWGIVSLLKTRGSRIQITCLSLLCLVIYLFFVSTFNVRRRLLRYHHMRY